MASSSSSSYVQQATPPTPRQLRVPQTPLSFASLLEGETATGGAQELARVFELGVEAHAARFPIDVFPPEIQHALDDVAALKRSSLGLVTASFQAATTSSMSSVLVHGLGSYVQRVLEFTVVLGGAGTGKTGAAEFGLHMVQQCRSLLMQASPYWEDPENFDGDDGGFEQRHCGSVVLIERVAVRNSFESTSAIIDAMCSTELKGDDMKDKSRSEVHQVVVSCYDEVESLLKVLVQPGAMAKFEEFYNAPALIMKATSSKGAQEIHQPLLNLFASGHLEEWSTAMNVPGRVTTGAARMKVVFGTGTVPEENELVKRSPSYYPLEVLNLTVSVFNNVDVGSLVPGASTSAAGSGGGGGEGGAGASAPANKTFADQIGNGYSIALPLERLEKKCLNVDVPQNSAPGLMLQVTRSIRVTAGQNANLSLKGAVVTGGVLDRGGVTENFVITNINGASVSTSSALLHHLASISAFGNTADLERLAPSSPLGTSPSASSTQEPASHENSRALFETTDDKRRRVSRGFESPPSGHSEEDDDDSNDEEEEDVVVEDAEEEVEGAPQWEKGFREQRPGSSALFDLTQPGDVWGEVVVPTHIEVSRDDFERDINEIQQVNATEGRSRPGIRINKVELGSVTFDKGVTAGSEIRGIDGVICVDIEDMLERLRDPESKYDVVLILPVRLPFTLTFKEITPEYQLLATWHNKIAKLTNAIKSDLSIYSNLWAKALCILLGKATASLTRIAANLRAIRLANEIVRRAKFKKGSIWRGRATGAHLTLIMDAWINMCASEGREPTEVFVGTDFETHLPACLIFKLELCDIIGAIALENYNIASSMLVLLAGENHEPSMENSSRATRMMNSPVVRDLFNTEMALHAPPEHKAFYVAVLLQPGCSRPLPYIGEGGKGRGLFLATALLKDRMRTPKGKATLSAVSLGVPCYSEAWLDVGRAMADLGLIEGVHFHQSDRTRPSSRRVFYELKDVNGLSTPELLAFTKLLKQHTGISLLQYEAARKIKQACTTSTNPDTKSKYERYIWPGKCAFPHPKKTPCDENMEVWHCFVDCTSAVAPAAASGVAAAEGAAPDADAGNTAAAGGDVTPRADAVN